MPYLGQKPKDTFTASASQTITGTGATSYSLNQTVTSPEDIEVFINNVQQQPTVAYTVSGQTITFDEALLSTDSCYVVFRGARAESRTHPAASNLQAADVTATNVNATAVTATTVTPTTLNATNVTVSGAFTSQGINDDATAEKITIKNTGRVGINQTNPRGLFAIGMNASSSDGLYLDNTDGGATMDLACLGSGYSAHQASPGEIWFYSPDNINIGGASGNTNDIKFLSNNVQRMRISGSVPGLIKVNGLYMYHFWGSVGGQTAINVDVTGVQSAGVTRIEAMYSHYSIGSYGAARISTLGNYGGSILSTNDIQNITSGNGGAWSYSTPTSGTIRITKSAGTYIGGGHYWVRVITYYGP